MLKDLRYAYRMLVKNYGFTLVAVITLGLGIGATTSIFSVVNGVLLRSLPYAESERLVMIWESWRGNGTAKVAWPKFMDWRKQQTSFESIAGMNEGTDYTLTEGDRPDIIRGLQVAPSFFDVLKLQPIQGRLLIADDALPGKEKVTVITEELWKERFSGDGNIIGKRIQLSYVPHSIVGVIPKGLKLSNKARLFVPIIEEGELITNRQNHSYQVIARLKSGVALAQAETEMNTIADRLEKAHPKTDEHWKAKLVSLHEHETGKLRAGLLVLMGAVALLLVIACTNVANLLLAKSASRKKEIAVRTALGSGHWRIARLLLAESFLLAIGGGLLGIALSYWLTSVLATLGAALLPQAISITMDWRVLAFTLGISALTGLVFGMVPALGVMQTDLTVTLKEGERGTSRAWSRNGLRHILVVAEMAVALILLIGAGLMLQSFVRLSKVNPGFAIANLLTVPLNPAEAKYGEGNKRHLFFDQVMERIRTIPGVEAVGGSHVFPMAGGGTQIYTRVIGRDELPESDRSPNYRIVTPQYFQAMGISLLSGRVFNANDTTNAPLVILVNESFVKRVFANENPIGKQLGIADGWGLGDKMRPREIVGVVSSIRQFTPDQEPQPEIYVPHLQSRWPYGLTLAVRAQGKPEKLMPEVRTAIWEMDRDQAIGPIKTMEEVVGLAVNSERFNTSLLAAFAALALMLAALGIYGVMTYTVAQRTQEIGIRMALGAQGRDVLSMVIRQGMLLALIGVGLGLGGAFALTRLLSSMLYAVQPSDPATFIGVALLLISVSLLACWLPARRATQVDPIIVMCCD